MITTEQQRWTEHTGWEAVGERQLAGAPQLVLVFGSSLLVNQDEHFETVKAQYPEAEIVMASSAGEILDTSVSDDASVLTAIHFEHTRIATATADIANATESRAGGAAAATKLNPDGLVHVLIISDGLRVNGTELVAGISDNLPEDVSVTGGLAGDGANFKHTFVGVGTAGREGRVALIGFYGTGLTVGYGSLGGWDPFGPERTITRSKGNVLFELDGEPALGLYKKYLGDKAKDLPGSGLLFPLQLTVPTDAGEAADVVRTLLAVDEEQGSMTFAGDMPEGAPAQLMKANFDRLVDGASGAAQMGLSALGETKPELAILISCIGRKLVLKERVEEELEAVRATVGADAALVGFYSYGEICPTAPTEKQCQLHNQTMTITVFREDEPNA